MFHETTAWSWESQLVFRNQGQLFSNLSKCFKIAGIEDDCLIVGLA